jgi:hypothetical protein
MLFEISNIERRLAHYYKVPRTTPMIGEDLKFIKKLNTVFIKLEKTDKEVYLLEAVNIVKTLNNILNVQDMQPIFLELVNLKYHQSVLFLLRNVEDLNASVIRRYLQENSEALDEGEGDD